MSIGANIIILCSFVAFIFPVWLLWLRHALRAQTTRSVAAAAAIHQKHDASDALRHSCRHCEKIVIRFPFHWPSKTHRFNVRLHHTVPEVYQAAADGCLFFKDLYTGFNVPVVNRLILHTEVLLSIFSPHSPVHAFTGCESFVERVVYFFRGLSDRPFHVVISRLNAEAGETLFARLIFSAWHSFELDVSADLDDHLAEYIDERPLTHEVFSDHIFQQARQWLTKCIRGHASHPQCYTERNTFVPTRLIEIRHHSDGYYIPRIYHSEEGETIQYACLSYCWGGDQAAKTTKARLASRVTLLPFTDLSRTLQDALIVADRIGFRYIWIDALCIIQDDTDDVAREISMLPDIYKYGQCTISASRASTSEEGFLQAHVTEQIYSKSIRLNVECPDGMQGHINLAYRGAEYWYAKEPIHKRAWCFQERLLSTRILDFEHTQLRWTCLSKVEVDGGKANLGAATDQLIGRSLEKRTRDQLDELWRDTVVAYTRRDLTFARDKLLAISAVASEFAPSFNDDYLAGFWRSSLAHQLAWTAGRPKKARPKMYIAPSWSWASAPDTIQWDLDRDGQSAVDILDCQVQLAHQYAPFGAVHGGFVLLKGQMRDVTWYFNRSEVQMRTTAGILTFIANREALEVTKGDGQTSFLGWPVPDALEEEWLQDPNFAVRLQCLKLRERTEKRGTRCIFVLPTSKARTSFRRVAFFEIGDARYRYDPPVELDFFEDIEAEEIKII